jgi:DEAD/DEAH box helicase
MSRDPQAISRALAELVVPQARGRLLALGLARGMVWKEGVVPDGVPDRMRSATLTPDLLDFGYGVLALALELRDANRERTADQRFETNEAFRVAAEAIESAVRRGDPNQGDQGRHLVVSAAAFHLAGYAARSFSLLPKPALERNLASIERALGLLLRRDIAELRAHIIRWYTNPSHNDEALVARLRDETDEFGPEDAAVLALSTSYHRSLGLADSALLSGTQEELDEAVRAMQAVVASAAQIGNIPTWWVATLTLHLVRDLWDQSLQVLIPSNPIVGAPKRWHDLRRDFIAQLATRRPPHIELWPSQVAAAARAADPNDDLIIALPTSAGKTRIAELCILRALADRKRTVYVTPLRALSAQVERVLARTFVPLNATVTSLYGASGATLVDAETLVSADIVVATPEKLDFALRQDPAVLNDVALIVFDEGHMIGLGSREIRYEVLIQRLLRRSDATARRIVCLSAMFNPDDPFFKDFGNWLRSDAPGEFVHVQWRPTRQRFATLDWSSSSNTGMLSFIDGERPYVPRFVEAAPAKGRRQNAFPQNDKEFCICAANAFANDGHTVLVYSPQRSQIEPLASEFRRIADQGYLPNVKPPDAVHVAGARAIGREWLGENHPAMRALEIGVGTHHGALPRPFLSAIEELLDSRRLSIVVASPTLAQGIDLACSVLIFRSLQRYENGKWGSISLAEFANVVGRAGRAYVDLDGIAIVPNFTSDTRADQHAMFANLVEKSKGQRLLSGLAHLIWRVSTLLTAKLGVSKDKWIEYVLNQRDLWADSRLVAETATDDDEDEIDDSLEKHIADLDVALFSLIEPLDANIDQLAAILDDVLKDSLWMRTLAHLSGPDRDLERAILRSRAAWLWSNTTPTQRSACFYASLGRKPGLFIHDQLDVLVDILATFQSAVAIEDGKSVAQAAAQFAECMMGERFFTVRKLPKDWEAALAGWVSGMAFSEILDGRKARDMQRTQAFIQEGVVFLLVWAAEAVRVQATAIGHARADELNDGPAFALTYGVPSIPAALLCQMGFPSRTGAVWVTSQLSASFTNMNGLRDWLREYDATLGDPDFWPSADHYLLWKQAATPTSTEYPRRWTHRLHTVSPQWTSEVLPIPNSPLRIIPGAGYSATICGTDLAPLGTADLPFDPHNAAVEGKLTSTGKAQITYFGR